jgi:steroid delta-isomerase-like uncharacterized protein
MSEQENITIVKKSFENLNKHDLEANDQYIAEGARSVAAGSPGELNREQARQYTQNFITAFPDLQFKVKDVIAQGDKVAATWMSNGTHTGPLITQSGDPIPATNRKVTVTGCTVFTFSEGKIVRQEIYWDQGMLMSQLGLM